LYLKGAKLQKVEKIENSNEELRKFYCSPNIIRMFKSRYIRRAGRVTSMAHINAYKILMLSLKERGN
jgi:hypothetical protein